MFTVAGIGALAVASAMRLRCRSAYLKGYGKAFSCQSKQVKADATSGGIIISLVFRYVKLTHFHASADYPYGPPRQFATDVNGPKKGPTPEPP